MTIVHLLRHGEVENPTGLLYGREPGYHLSKNGQIMALIAADYLANLGNINHVRVSPLERAQETAEPLATALGWDPVTDERVIETDNLFSGMRLSPNATGLITRPALWKRLYNPYNPSWGEPYDGMVQRVMAAVHDAREAAQGADAVIVSHQLPIWATRLFLEGRPQFHDPHSRQCDLCSITSLHFEGDWVVQITYAEPVTEYIAKYAAENASAS